MEVRREVTGLQVHQYVHTAPAITGAVLLPEAVTEAAEVWAEAAVHPIQEVAPDRLVQEVVADVHPEVVHLIPVADRYSPN